MLLVVNRYRKTNEVDVLDTDDMVVERADFDKLKGSGVAVLGLTFRTGIFSKLHVDVWMETGCFNLVFDENINYVTCRPDLFDAYCVLPSAITNFKVLEKYDYESVAVSTQYIRYLVSINSPLSVLCFYLSSVYMAKELRVVDELLNGYSLFFDDIEFPCNQYLFDKLVLLYLYGLYDFKVNCASHYCELKYNVQSDLFSSIVYSDICNCVEIVKYQNSVYFCDNRCMIKVSCDKLRQVSGLKSYMLFNTKCVALNVPTYKDLITGHVYAKSSKKFVMKNIGEPYYLDGTIDYIDLTINKGVKVLASNRLKLGVLHLTDYSGNYDILSQICVEYTHSYSFTLDSFNRSFLFDWVNRSMNISVCDIKLLDEITKENVNNLFNKMLKPDDIRELKRGIISGFYYELMQLVDRFDGIELLDNKLRVLLDYRRYMNCDGGMYMLKGN